MSEFLRFGFHQRKIILNVMKCHWIVYPTDNSQRWFYGLKLYGHQ